MKNRYGCVGPSEDFVWLHQGLPSHALELEEKNVIKNERRKVEQRSVGNAPEFPTLHTPASRNPSIGWAATVDVSQSGTNAAEAGSFAAEQYEARRGTVRHFRWL